MPVNEAGVVREVVTAVRRRWPNALLFKIHGSPFQPVGIPDLLACVEGWFIGMEVKYQRPGESRAHAVGRATPVQQAMIQKIREAKGRADVVTSGAEAVALIEEVLRER